MTNTFIEKTILKLCDEPRDFGFLAKELFGLDPIALNETLSHLVKTKLLKINDYKWVVKGYRYTKKKNAPKSRSVSKFTENKIPYFNLFAKPHPLDFEWRYSLDTLNFICNSIWNSQNETHGILLLGMPSIFIASYYKKLPQKFTLIDNNKTILESIRNNIPITSNFEMIHADIFDFQPKKIEKCETAFIDPPWYNDHFHHFIWMAAQCVDIGGLLIMSVPPINTRPGLDKERQEWFNFAEQQGFYLENLLCQKLEYVMPFFEFNAMRAAGLRDILPFWRKGDLATFRKLSSVDTKRPKKATFVNNWAEIEIDGVRIRIGSGRPDEVNVPLSIHHLIKGDILPSVSSRDPRRREPNIWTSGNRIFWTNQPMKFLQLITEFKKNSKNPTKDFKIVNSFLNYLVEIEKKEYLNYSEWLIYEMERQDIEKVNK